MRGSGLGFRVREFRVQNIFQGWFGVLTLGFRVRLGGDLNRKDESCFHKWGPMLGIMGLLNKDPYFLNARTSPRSQASPILELP